MSQPSPSTCSDFIHLATQLHSLWRRRPVPLPILYIGEQFIRFSFDSVGPCDKRRKLLVSSGRIDIRWQIGAYWNHTNAILKAAQLGI